MSHSLPGSEREGISTANCSCSLRDGIHGTDTKWTAAFGLPNSCRRKLSVSSVICAVRFSFIKE